jgi:predicted nucleic acid-binding protein
MICAVDTNVILDVLADDPEFGERSERLLADALDSGSLVICELVYAELAPQFETHEALDSALAAMGARVVEGGIEVAWDAGRRMADYRSAGGSKQRLLADFYIGAHAAHRAEALLTRDRGFYGTYFPELKLIGGG